VAEARAGWNDERGFAADVIPGMGLHKVLGCRETAVQSPPGRKTKLRWEDGVELPAVIYEETLEPLNPMARIVARFPNGDAAAIAATYGKGKTLALGSFLSAAYERERDPALRKFFTGLLAWAGVEPPFTVTGNAEVRLLESGGAKLLFAFNHTDRPVAVSVEFKRGYTATDLITGLPAALSGTLPPREVRVLRLE
jgi:beta-galactosidase